MYYDRRYSETVLQKESESGLPFKKQFFVLALILIAIYALIA